ncbi:hypothetical protein BVRB_8g182720 [Beta vulgaris subsp. vulgaris]|nr:hypothetical protein BVRB_8g182720 [Beta vulgaris subsp. vulgaris]
MMEKGATLDADVGGKMMDEEVAVGDADAHVKAKSKKKRRLQSHALLPQVVNYKALFTFDSLVTELITTSCKN